MPNVGNRTYHFAGFLSKNDPLTIRVLFRFTFHVMSFPNVVTICPCLTSRSEKDRQTGSQYFGTPCKPNLKKWVCERGWIKNVNIDKF